MSTTRTDKITSAKIKSAPIYSDFFTNFNKHPETAFLVRSLNADAVKKSLRNLILTNRGERLFQPKIGCDVRKMLFENFSPVTTNMIKLYIEEAINNYEPRVKVLQIYVNPDEQNNSYNIIIEFQIITSNDPITLDLTLYRVR